ncbi:MAG: hypothetical protein MJZ33_00660 [Paludibacteraceae bacterium]|nr:hypothetical protein [Paludibacteraceae bacterium]
MIKNLLFFAVLGMLFSCSDSKDCECTRTDVQNGEPSKVDVYDYDGSCSELNEKDVDCKEI